MVAALCTGSAQRDRKHSWGKLDAPGASQAIEFCKPRGAAASTAVARRVSGEAPMPALRPVVSSPLPSEPVMLNST